jgi:branched-chain amino acid transport system ATP-binding protein
MASGALLRIDSVRLAFGGLSVLDGVSFDLKPGRICGLIGPNGAGKTSLFNCVCGLYRPDAGAIALDGRSLRGLPAEALPRLGLARTFQQAAAFGGLTVHEQVLVALESRGRPNWLAHALGLPSARRTDLALRRQADQLLERFGLADRSAQPVSALSAAALRQLELARALALEPKLLLLDEPAAGLDRQAQQALAHCLRALCDRTGLTILVIEHRMQWLRSICDQLVALRAGRVIASGDPDAVFADPAVIEACLGRIH